MMLGPSHSRRASDQLFRPYCRPWNWDMGMGQKYWWNQHPLTSYDHPGTIRVPPGYQGFDSSPYGSSSKDLVNRTLPQISISESISGSRCAVWGDHYLPILEMFYKVTGHVLGVQPKLGSTDDVYIFPFRGTARYLTIGKTLIWRHDWNGLIFIVCIVLMIVAIFTNF